MTLLYFSPVPWDSYSQRPHYFARYFLSRPGRRVVWVDPYPTRFPALKDVRWTRARPHLPTVRPDRLTVVRPRALPVEPLAAGRWINRHLAWRHLTSAIEIVRASGPLVIGVGRPSDLARHAVTSLHADRSFYDAMDDFPEFYSGRSRGATEVCEEAIAASVDTIYTVSSALWTKFSTHGSKRVMLANAFEMSSLPAIGASRETAPPVLGFVGCIASWFDWPMVVALAESDRTAEVRIIGPQYDPAPVVMPDNVRLFPACPHEAGVRYMREFTVGLIPFRRNRLTAGVDPIKYYGYRGMGLPVLTTSFGEMAGRGAADAAYFLDGPAGLSCSATAARAHRDGPGAIEAFRARHTWDRRFADVGLFEDLPSS